MIGPRSGCFPPIALSGGYRPADNLIQIRLAQARDPENNRTMRQITRILAAAMLLGIVVPAQAQPAPVDAPFTETLSNATPLAFGMAADTAAHALGTPLSYISGRPGNEIYLA